MYYFIDSKYSFVPNMVLKLKSLSYLYCRNLNMIWQYPYVWKHTYFIVYFGLARACTCQY